MIEEVELYHYTNEPLTCVRDIIQPPELYHIKPHGLWVSVDDAWSSWCKDEAFGLKSLALRYKITLSKAQEILWITSMGGIFQFIKDYTADTPWHLRGYIDWHKVAQRWAGIIITPYQWEARLDPDTFWYYGWDCASGCIWSKDAIDSIVLE